MRNKPEFDFYDLFSVVGYRRFRLFCFQPSGTDWPIFSNILCKVYQVAAQSSTKKQALWKYCPRGLVVRAWLVLEMLLNRLGFEDPANCENTADRLGSKAWLVLKIMSNRLGGDDLTGFGKS